jgi:hypothetical protein
MDGDDTPQNLLAEVREQNSRLQQLIDATVRIVARSRELLSRLGGHGTRNEKSSTDA